PRQATRLSRSFLSAKTRQRKQGSCSVGGLAPATYAKRQGAHRRSIRGSFHSGAEEIQRLTSSHLRLRISPTLQFALAVRHLSISPSHSMLARSGLSHLQSRAPAQRSRRSCRGQRAAYFAALVRGS